MKKIIIIEQKEYQISNNNNAANLCGQKKYNEDEVTIHQDKANKQIKK